jgi:hypothetical protein
MVTASGNFWGTLSFNGREIYFSSSLEPEDGHKGMYVSMYVYVFVHIHVHIFRNICMHR